MMKTTQNDKKLYAARLRKNDTRQTVWSSAYTVHKSSSSIKYMHASQHRKHNRWYRHRQLHGIRQTHTDTLALHITALYQLLRCTDDVYVCTINNKSHMLLAQCVHVVAKFDATL